MRLRLEKAEDWWVRARDGDSEALTIRRALLSEQEEEVLSRRRAWRRPRPRRRDTPSVVRGEAISRDQLYKRAARVKGLKTCRLCPKIVHHREYHRDCWDTWRASPEFQRERERRRWSTDKSDNGTPISPPQPPGRPPRELAKNYVWFMKKLDGVPLHEMAKAAKVSVVAVSQGIADLKRRLTDPTLVFRDPTGKLNALRTQAWGKALQTLNLRGEEPHIRRLAYYAMAPEKIARLFCCSPGEVRDILHTPETVRWLVRRGLQEDEIAGRTGYSAEDVRELLRASPPRDGAPRGASSVTLASRRSDTTSAETKMVGAS